MKKIVSLVALMLLSSFTAVAASDYHLQGVVKDGVLYVSGQPRQGGLTSEEVRAGQESGKYRIQGCDWRINRELTQFALDGTVCLEQNETGCVKWSNKPFCKPGQRPLIDIQNSEHVYCTHETSPRFFGATHLPSFQALVFCELADGEPYPADENEK